LPGREVRIRALAGLGEVGEGDPLGGLIAIAAAPAAREIVVVSQKVVSKSEGRLRDLDGVTPGPEAEDLAERTGKDPRLMELVLGESTRVVRAAPGVLITETRSGWVCANAGIDGSNVEGDSTVALLPEDPDASAREIRSGIRRAAETAPAVVIADSFGRPWRLGQADVAIGCAGVAPLDDWRGRADAHGKKLAATLIATADQLAAAADLSRDKDDSLPGAVISGLDHLVTEDDGPGAAAIRRPGDRDLFR
jgi:coenzyme F420-0:L-glutamate ligase / coenzyme F420-1:gamma-L-glutamate ligase